MGFVDKTHRLYKAMARTMSGRHPGCDGVGNSVNNKGLVSGAADLTGDTTEHAALWRDGVITDLGTLGGPDSFINAPVKNDSGEIAGFAETSTPDPIGETFCLGVSSFGFQDGVTCLGFLWQDGVMAPLPPLAGGNNSQASGVNNRGPGRGIRGEWHSSFYNLAQNRGRSCGANSATVARLSPQSVK